MLSGLVVEPARTWALWESEPHMAPVFVGGAPADLCTEHPFWPGSRLHSPACVWEDASSRSLHCRVDQWLWRWAEMVKWDLRKVYFEINFQLHKIICLLFCEIITVLQMSTPVLMLPISNEFIMNIDFSSADYQYVLIWISTFSYIKAFVNYEQGPRHQVKHRKVQLFAPTYGAEAAWCSRVSHALIYTERGVGWSVFPHPTQKAGE